MPRSALAIMSTLPPGGLFELDAVPVELATLPVHRPGGELADDVGPRRTRMLAYTGAIFDAGFGPAVIDLEGLELPAEGMPLFRQHDPGLFVGRSDDIEKTESELTVLGFLFDGVAEAEEIQRISDQGGKFQSSIGVRIDFEALEFVEAGQTVEVNGTTLTGPFVLLRRTTLREASFVPLGADPNTSAVALAAAAEETNQLAQEAQLMEEKERIAALSAEFKDDPAFALKAISKGWTLADAKERAAELAEARAEQKTTHDAALAAQKTEHDAALATANAAPTASPAAMLAGLTPAGDDDPDNAASSFDGLVEAEEAKLREKGHTGAKLGSGLRARLATTARGRYVNLRATAVANVAAKHPEIHRAYLEAHNAVVVTRRGR